jgi:hypothetical protein
MSAWRVAEASVGASHDDLSSVDDEALYHSFAIHRMERVGNGPVRRGPLPIVRPQCGEAAESNIGRRYGDRDPHTQHAEAGNAPHTVSGTQTSLLQRSLGSWEH